MSAWKAKLPKAKPAAGRVQFVFSIKTSSGMRVEQSGDGPSKKVMRSFDSLLGIKGLSSGDSDK